MMWKLSWCDGKNDECGGICPCVEYGFVVEDWAKGNWFERLVVFSCDDEILMEVLFELLDRSFELVGSDSRQFCHLK